MLDREQALSLISSQGISNNLFNHLLESEVVMDSLAQKLEQDNNLWALTGLLHDLDYLRIEDPAEHGLLAAEMLSGKLPNTALYAIKAHNWEMNQTPPQDLLDYALRCGETVTGLISANALIRSQGIHGMKPKSIKKKMKDKHFAANVSRERVRECEKIGLELDEFLQISIAAVAEIADQVGLGTQRS